MLRFFLLALMALPAAAAAEEGQGLPCAAPLLLGGAEAGQAPEVIHVLPASPGAFGGQVQCVQDAGSGRVERYWIELLPESAETREHIRYRSGAIDYFLQFRADEGPAQLVAGCTRPVPEELVCRVDLAAGKGLVLARFFGPDLALTGLRLLAYPARGVVNPALWQQLGAEVLSGQLPLEMDLWLPQGGSEARTALAPQEDSAAGELVLGIGGAEAAGFAQQIYASPQPVVLEARITSGSGAEAAVTTATHQVSEGNLAYLLDKLAKLEQLMVAGFESSREMKF